MPRSGWRRAVGVSCRRVGKPSAGQGVHLGMSATNAGVTPVRVQLRTCCCSTRAELRSGRRHRRHGQPLILSMPFVWVSDRGHEAPGSHAACNHQQLSRRTAKRSWRRFGLPSDHLGWQQKRAAIRAVRVSRPLAASNLVAPATWVRVTGPTPCRRARPCT